MQTRIPAFIAVGAVGFIIQVSSLALLTTAVGWPYVPATAVAVQLAVLNNFAWHERWTWRERRATGSAVAWRLARYEVTTGVTSIAGNLVCAAVLVEGFGLNAVAANAIAVALMSAANFVVSDRWVFSRALAVSAGVMLASWPASSLAAEAMPATMAAWNRYVTDTEARVNRTRDVEAPGVEPHGDAISVPGGMIHDWRGSTIVRHTTVDAMVNALMHPGTPPPQEDVLESRVLARSGDTLCVYLKLVRKTIITVTYDTEHQVTFARHSPRLATSRSVSTKIAESDGRDRGFLWRLNSYWRYAQVGNDVRVEVESLSLSRDVPMVLRPVAGPIINRIARESMLRTLQAIKDFFETN